MKLRGQFQLQNLQDYQRQLNAEVRFALSRYAGYVAWRGVIPADEHPDVSSVEWQLSCTQSGQTKQRCAPQLAPAGNLLASPMDAPRCVGKVYMSSTQLFTL
jgi:hypothetical protein